MDVTPSPTSFAKSIFTSPSSQGKANPFYFRSLQNVVIYFGCVLVIRLGFSFLKRFLVPIAPPVSTTTRTDQMSSKAEPGRRPISQAELSAARGGEGQPLYIAMKDPYSDKTNVFDVSSGHAFYGPKSGYHLFTGRDATYGLATSCLDPAKQDGDLSTLTQSQNDTHVQWYEKYASKYPIVGQLIDGNSDSIVNSKKDD